MFVATQLSVGKKRLLKRKNVCFCNVWALNSSMQQSQRKGKSCNARKWRTCFCCVNRRSCCCCCCCLFYLSWSFESMFMVQILVLVFCATMAGTRPLGLSLSGSELAFPSASAVYTQPGTACNHWTRKLFFFETITNCFAT